MTTTTYILLGGGFLLLIALIVAVVISLNSDREVQSRIDQFGPNLTPTKEDREAAKKNSQVMTAWLNDRVGKSSWGEGISRDLARADLKMTPGEFIALLIISSFGVAMLFWFIGGNSILFAALGAIVGFFIPRIYLNSQKSHRLVRFNEQLGDMLSLMVNGLRAGYSTMQAMESVSKELPAPISDEFRRVVLEMQLGVPMEQALANLLRRIPSEDLDLVITAINVQREVGGNLAEILDTISYTIRERVRIKGEIRVLTTQVMYSGRILALLPVALMGILYVLNRDYMMEFFKPANNATLPCGYMGLVCAGLLILAGYLTMQKIGQIEI